MTSAVIPALPREFRRSCDLIAIADTVDPKLLSATLVQGCRIGWSKARLIAQRTGTKPEARRAIAFARHNTLPALAAYFQRGGNGMALVTKSFHLTKAQADELESALVKRRSPASKGPDGMPSSAYFAVTADRF